MAESVGRTNAGEKCRGRAAHDRARRDVAKNAHRDAVAPRRVLRPPSPPVARDAGMTTVEREVAVQVDGGASDPLSPSLSPTFPSRYHRR